MVPGALHATVTELPLVDDNVPALKGEMDHSNILPAVGAVAE